MPEIGSQPRAAASPTPLENGATAVTTDTIASILTSGLLGEVYVGLDAGGDTKMVTDGGKFGKTQSAVVLEKLIGQLFVDKATFVALGGVDDLYNGKYGTQNAAGTASAASLQIEINGLRVRKAPFFPAATMLVGSSEAAKFAESGPMVATEEDVKRLGRNVAVWGMYEDAEVYFPGALQVYKAA